jgi:hypothetical protein
MKSPIDEALTLSRRLRDIDRRESFVIAKKRRKYEEQRQDLVRGASPEVQRVLDAAGLWPANNLPAESPPVEAEAQDDGTLLPSARIPCALDGVPDADVSDDAADMTQVPACLKEEYVPKTARKR